jgi:hypothetical protein
VKLFAERPGGEPLADLLADVIPVFHAWIRDGGVPGGLLIDVHDYSHVPAGPGVLLVGHDVDYGLDCAGDRPGLALARKRPFGASFAERLRLVARDALAACTVLESTPSLAGRLRFRHDEALVVVNDRLHAPNTEATFDALRHDLDRVMRDVLGIPAIALVREPDPKRRFAVHARVSS